MTNFDCDSQNMTESNIPVMLSFSSLPQESKSILFRAEKKGLNKVTKLVITAWKYVPAGLCGADELTLCLIVGWWSSYKEERGMWTADLFPFHCLLSEGREVNKNSFIHSLLLSFVPVLVSEQSCDTHWRKEILLWIRTRICEGAESIFE